MPENCKAILGGREWDIVFVTKKDMPKDTWGDCNWENAKIRVRKDLSRLNVLDTLIHEMRHAQHHVLFEAEQFITNTSTELAKALVSANIHI